MTFVALLCLSLMTYLSVSLIGFVAVAKIFSYEYFMKLLNHNLSEYFVCDKTELLFKRNQTVHNICGYLFCPCISNYRYNSWPGPSLLPPASWEDLSLFSFYREMILCMQEKGEREIEYIFPQLSSFKLYHWARQHTTYIYPSCIVLPGIFRYFIY